MPNLAPARNNWRRGSYSVIPRSPAARLDCPPRQMSVGAIALLNQDMTSEDRAAWPTLVRRAQVEYKNRVDYVALKKELLETFVGDRSTREVSEILGYDFDQVRRWKSGRKELRWDEFCDLCEALRAPLGETLREVFFFGATERFDSCHGFPQHLRRYFLADLSLRELSRKFASHASVLKRVFSGEVYPSLELLLAFMERQPALKTSFVVKLLGLDSPGRPLPTTPLLREFAEEHHKIHDESHQPIACAIESLLCIEEYKTQARHDPEWFCGKLGIELKGFASIWSQLVRTQRVQAMDDGKYRVTFDPIRSQWLHPAQSGAKAKFWTERAWTRSEARTVNSDGSTSMMTCHVLPMSDETARKTTAVLLRAQQEILSLVAADSGPQQDVRVLLLHHFGVAEIAHPADLDTESEQTVPFSSRLPAPLA